MKYVIMVVIGLCFLVRTAQAETPEVERLKREVAMLQLEITKIREEFKLIQINSGHMVEQMNALTKLVHEINKSPKTVEQTNTRRKLLDEIIKSLKTVEQTNALRNYWDEINKSPEMVEQMNTLGKLLDEIINSPETAEQNERTKKLWDEINKFPFL